jgi:phosphopantothenate--cysteine ligase
MLAGKKILVTSGGTQEYIDDVRVLTNISSGKLGAEIAISLIEANVDVYYLKGVNAEYPDPMRNGYYHDIRVKSAQDAYNEMEKLVPDMDAVIHCMAVSDFTFKRDVALKCKSSDPQAFIDFMARTITKNPKIISKVKEWNPKTILVGFKFEVGIPHEELISLAETSIKKNGCDLVVANDKEEMIRDKAHTAYLIEPCGTTLKVSGKKEIATQIQIFLMNAFSNTKYVGIHE